MEGSTSLESLYIGTRKIPANLCENFRKLSEVTASSQITEIGRPSLCAVYSPEKNWNLQAIDPAFHIWEKIGDYAFFPVQCV